MEKRCQACGMVNPEDATVCPCGTVLSVQDESDFQSTVTKKQRSLLLWLGIFLSLVATVAFLRFLNAPSQPGESAGEWKTRELKDARISLSAPGPFEPITLEAMGMPKALRDKLARGDFYRFGAPGFFVMAGRLQVKNADEFPSPSAFLPSQAEAKASKKLQSALCMAGSNSGIMVEDRFMKDGRDLVSKSFVIAGPPEMWLINVLHVEADKSAEDDAQRVIDSIRIDGQPIVVLEAPSQSLSNGWQNHVLVPGSLTASSPTPWTESERAAVALEAQLPCRPSDARYFICQSGPVSFTVGTGTCSDDQSDYVNDELKRSSKPPQAGILLGRRAAVWSKQYELGGEEWISRKVVTASGTRSWIFEAQYPARHKPSQELVDRVQASLQER